MHTSLSNTERISDNQFPAHIKSPEVPSIDQFPIRMEVTELLSNTTETIFTENIEGAYNIINHRYNPTDYYISVWDRMTQSLIKEFTDSPDENIEAALATSIENTITQSIMV